jgi:hypothetical protein
VKGDVAVVELDGGDRQTLLAEVGGPPEHFVEAFHVARDWAAGGGHGPLERDQVGTDSSDGASGSAGAELLTPQEHERGQDASGRHQTAGGEAGG